MSEYKPFRVEQVWPGGPSRIYRPLVEVRVIGPKRSRRFEGRLDTGADDSLLPWTAIDYLGVELLPRSGVDIKGIGGVERVMFGYVDLEFLGLDGPIRWSHCAGFSPGDHTVFGLSGFLEYFVARFDGPKREVKLQYRGKAPPPRFEPPLPRRAL